VKPKSRTHFAREFLWDPQGGHLMGMQTVAEFVENDEIFSALRAIGVDFGQGYGIAKPVPLITALERFGRKSDNLHSRALSGA
jgi:EAL domain-containing protein (putative c-di-GMP-specific phosphodiesterase class I)